MKVEDKKYTLILSKSFVPLGVEKVKKVMKYLINEQGKALDPETFQLYSFEDWIELNSRTEKESTIRTEKLWIMIPEILVLNRDNVYVKRKTTGISTRKVFERDDYICNYCGIKLSSKVKTIDHVQPKSKGGVDAYNNVVACCIDCNRQKGNTLLSELRLIGPHKCDKHGNMVLNREKRWTIKNRLVSPSQSILYGIPKHKWLESWRAFLQPEMSLV